MPCDPCVSRVMPVPEVDEGLSQLGSRWPSNAQVGIPPGGRVETSDVKSANKAGVSIHDEEFAVIKRVASRVKQVPGTTNCLIFQHMHVCWEDLEVSRHDRISKAIKDHAHLHSLSGCAGEMVLERLANSVAFPNIGFQVNTLLSRIYRSEHRLVEIAPIIVELEAILPKRDFT